MSSTRSQKFPQMPDSKARTANEVNRSIQHRVLHTRKTRSEVLGKRDAARGHLFSAKHVPYPATYATKLLDCDDLDAQFLRDLQKEGPQCELGNKPPKRSLDLGCGRGAATIAAAKEWPSCHFVGFDVIDVQPNPQILEPKIGSRITWVHGNFLEPLPFESGSFDHVRAYRIALGIPENKWDGLFEEIARVLQPGGVFEMVEENLIFPCGQPPSPRSAFSSSLTSPSDFRLQPSPQKPFFARKGSTTGSSNSSHPSPPPTPIKDIIRPRRSLNLPLSASTFAFMAETGVSYSNKYQRGGSKSSVSSSSSSLSSHHPILSSNTTVTSSLSRFTMSSRRLSSATQSQRSRGASDASSSQYSNQMTLLKSRPHTGSGITAAAGFKLAGVRPTESGRPRGVPHPRDHTILKMAFEAMLEERYINPNPLSVLPHYLALHLTDVVSLTPVQVELPKPPRSNPRAGRRHRESLSPHTPLACTPSPTGDSPNLHLEINHKPPAFPPRRPSGRPRAASTPSSILAVVNDAPKGLHEHESSGDAKIQPRVGSEFPLVSALIVEGESVRAAETDNKNSLAANVIRDAHPQAAAPNQHVCQRKPDKPPERQSSLTAYEEMLSLHLIRAFTTVSSCKAEIRRQFLKMDSRAVADCLPRWLDALDDDEWGEIRESAWGEDDIAVVEYGGDDFVGEEVLRDTYGEDLTSLSKEDQFEYLWRNYVFDMNDRADLGKVVSQRLGWIAGSDSLTERQKRLWKKHVAKADHMLELADHITGPGGDGKKSGVRPRVASMRSGGPLEPIFSACGEPLELCRVVRGFRAVKPGDTFNVEDIILDEEIQFAQRSFTSEDEARSSYDDSDSL